MTGRERADKVREELYRARASGQEEYYKDAQVFALALLPPGSVILTADEAKQVRFALQRGGYRARVEQTEIWKPCREALSLLGGGS